MLRGTVSGGAMGCSCVIVGGEGLARPQLLPRAERVMRAIIKYQTAPGTLSQALSYISHHTASQALPLVGQGCARRMITIAGGQPCSQEGKGAPAMRPENGRRLLSLRTIRWFIGALRSGAGPAALRDIGGK